MGVVLPELRADTVADLWRLARVLGERADEEASPVPLRRALVAAALAGSSDSPDGFSALVGELHRVAVRLGLDPVPLFDAASALVAEDDAAARQLLVTYPRRPPGERGVGAAAVRELDGRLRGP